MKRFLSILLCLAAFATHAQEKPKVTPAMKRFVYQTSSSIYKEMHEAAAGNFNVVYKDGDKWVFKFSFRGEDNEMMSDDEFFESFEFEIAPPKGNTFEIKEVDFAKSNVIYTRSCFCADAGPRVLYEGNITGKKVGRKKWLITFEGSINARPDRQEKPFPRQWKGYFNPGKLVY
ncbi:MAG: hypothetical protein SGJ00_12540 [bacterium]|nr:hypothetical protein [bacterium]